MNVATAIDFVEIDLAYSEVGDLFRPEGAEPMSLVKSGWFTVDTSGDRGQLVIVDRIEAGAFRRRHGGGFHRAPICAVGQTGDAT